MRPTFSVVVTTFNRLEGLKRALASVYWQTDRDFELIVADAGSKDGTLRFLDRCGLPLRVIVVPGNPGLARLMNEAVSQARGRYVAFLESDDYWARDYLGTMRRAFNRPKAQCARSCHWVGTRDGRIIHQFHWRDYKLSFPCVLGLPETQRRLVWLSYGSLKLSFTVFRRELFRRIGPFDEAFKWIGVDSDFALRILASCGEEAFVHFDEALGTWVLDHRATQLTGISAKVTELFQSQRRRGGLASRSERYQDVLLDSIIHMRFKYPIRMKRLRRRISAILARTPTRHAFSLS